LKAGIGPLTNANQRSGLGEFRIFAHDVILLAASH
jgi:hypothetical protein